MTTATKKYASELHFEHQVWMQEMSFYKEQLMSFRHRLEEIAGKYNQQDVLQQLEHFQNQFILQNEQADILLHDLKGHEQILIEGKQHNSRDEKQKTQRLAIIHPMPVEVVPNHPARRGHKVAKGE